jgi:hypothetical protein
LQRAELFDDQEPEDDDGAAGIQEILPPLPQAYAAQGSEIGKRAERAISHSGKERENVRAARPDSPRDKKRLAQDHKHVGA